MKASIRKLLDKVNSVPDFLGVTLQNINDTNSFGDNALHCVCVWGDFDAAKLLVENGINIEQRGEGGFTPLKVANDFGHKEIVSYLISKGANAKALSDEFQFNVEDNAEHLQRLREGISILEAQIKSAYCENAPKKEDV